MKPVLVCVAERSCGRHDQDRLAGARIRPARTPPRKVYFGYLVTVAGY